MVNFKIKQSLKIQLPNIKKLQRYKKIAAVFLSCILKFFDSKL